MKRLFVAALAFVPGLLGTPAADAGIAFFGYQGGADDDASLAATAAYTNIAVTDGIDGMGSSRFADRVEGMTLRGVRAMVELTSVLFAPGGAGWALRPDAEGRWAAFVSENLPVLDADHVACFYVMNEPTWNRVPPDDLDRAATMVKASFPEIATAIVEAWPAADDLVLPPSVDWAGIDEYALRDPAVDPVYRSALATLKRKLRPGQRLIYVMDGWWAAGLHGAAGIAPADMAEIASRWFDLARADPDAVLLGVFTWPSAPGHLGTADLPAAVRERHVEIARVLFGRARIAASAAASPALVTPPDR